jgi:hypothetical protein
VVAEPTGQEHLTPVEIHDTSATERAGFRKCRRQWFLTTVHRLDPQEGNPNFFLGNLFHKALEMYYKAVAKGMSHADAAQVGLDAYEHHYLIALGEIKQQLGFVWKIAEPMWKETGELGFDMAQNYFDAEEHNPLFDEVVAVESRVIVPIFHPDDADRHVPSAVGYLSVQTDIVGRKDGVLKAVDTKTATRQIDSAHLDIDDQLTAEVYAVWKSTGEFPEKAVYNVAYKKTAKPPKQIKGTKKHPVKLSRAKDQGTTHELYWAEIKRLGLDPADYDEILSHLKALDAAGENVFFTREETFRSPGQMAAFERDLFHEFMDMKEVAAEPERAYPNPSRFNCPSCPVRTICFTIQDDGDVSAIIQAGFVIGDPRR